jgi:diaminopimelate epimerase
MTTDFEKYEGLGNDFLIVEAQALPESAEVRALCDRHFGVGGDGVLVVSPARTPGARARMTVLNADGSRPEMCGNGLRCVALHLARSDDVEQARYVIDTDAGPLECLVGRDGGAARVRLQIGRAVHLGTLHVAWENDELAFERVSIGNPHAILIEGPAFGEAGIDALGPRVSAMISGGSNVEFVRQRGPLEFDLAVWERGVGRTLACGTGAAATAAVLTRTGKAPFGTPFVIRLAGGPLTLEVEEDLSVTLEGPARHVFSGSWRAESSRRPNA